MKFKPKTRMFLLFLALLAIFMVSALFNIKSVTKTSIAQKSSAEISAVQSNIKHSFITAVSKTDIETFLSPDSVTIQMGGDVLLHENVYEAIRSKNGTYEDLSYFFSLFSDVFVSDLNIINLEAPVNAYGNNKTLAGYPDFNMPNEILPTLKNINVDLCITANNHTVDRGFKGLCRSLENIRNAGLDSVGAYATQESADTPYIVELNNIRVGVAAFTIRTNGKVLSSAPYSVNICGTKYNIMCDSILPEVQKLKDNGAEFIIVAMHWGGEYKDMPSSTQKKLAKTLCEAGVDIIMGSHSHCVQPIEMLTVDRGGVPSKALVIYSLGNLFADQTGVGKAKTQEGMIVSAKAVRGEDGVVRLEESFYMPTYTYVKGGSGINYMRIIPAGEYAFASDMPSFFKNESDWKKCKNAWKNVNDAVGNTIPSITGPSSYPQGFFTATEEISDSDII